MWKTKKQMFLKPYLVLLAISADIKVIDDAIIIHLVFSV